MVCNISDTQAKGWTGLLTKEFSRVKSVTILTLLPSGFTTKNAGEHHSVGVWQGVITFLSSSSFMQASAGSRKRSGICRAAETLNGVAFGFRCKWTSSELIGSVPRLSLNTVRNLFMMSC